MVHAADDEKLLLEEIAAVDQVSLRPADDASDLLASALRLLFQRDLLVDLGVNLLLEPDVEQFRVAGFLVDQRFFLMEVERGLEGLVRLLVHLVDAGVVDRRATRHQFDLESRHDVSHARLGW